jgi:formate hydrogenlyase subunit 3/multisubunit Na+/H+ antiporter MnhD subunit
MMFLILLSVVTLAVSGALAVLAKDGDGWLGSIGPAGAVVGCSFGFLGSLLALFSGNVLSLRWAWAAPGGALHLRLDALSAFFLIPIMLLGGLCSVYGASYLRSNPDKKSVRASWFHYNLLVASMALVVLARNGILFLIAWETMALASFFLVMFDHEKGSVREAGWTYMVATHIGTAFLLVLFAVLGAKAGSLDFDAFAEVGSKLSGASSLVLFVFAMIGFGTKAGFMPAHVWLPEAHPAAPSHVSALMSGVMIKTGVYGLLRLLECLNTPVAWRGWTLLIIGVISGILGVLFALAQHDVKRLLAYHSVENIGIIAMGLGLGYLGLHVGSRPLALLGFAGALLHVLNHAIFKGLLFLGAGSVLHAAGTGDIDSLGGLLKRMRVTGTTFLIGAVAICGLPPLNGFVSEFLIYFGAFKGVATASGVTVAALLTILAGLALIGGLAAACFTKAFGAIFLGEPRSERAKHCHEADAGMRWPMIILASACVLIGFLSPFAVRCVAPAADVLAPRSASDSILSNSYVPALSAVIAPLFCVSAISLLVVAFVAGLALLRKGLLSGRVVTEAGTWDCGYAAPTARMQYSASSFAQPLTRLFGPILRTRFERGAIEGAFPEETSFVSETRDLFRNEIYDPLFRRAEVVLTAFRKIQVGRVQLYVLYIALTLCALLAFAIE